MKIKWDEMGTPYVTSYSEDPGYLRRLLRGWKHRHFDQVPMQQSGQARLLRRQVSGFCRDGNTVRYLRHGTN